LCAETAIPVVTDKETSSIDICLESLYLLAHSTVYAAGIVGGTAGLEALLK